MESISWSSVFGMGWIIAVIIAVAACLGIWFWRVRNQFKDYR